MKSRTLINILEVALLIAVLAAIILTLWTSAPALISLATVSWNG